jgi:8-oxo-dGTP pyrophosphatase MutT (NUDIX family)
VRAALDAHRAQDAAERDALARASVLLDGPSDPFARTTLPMHFTASGLVLDPRTGSLLLHRHRRLGRWLQPGGHIEAAEHPADAAQRETVEETGVLAAHPSGGPVLVHVDEHVGPDGHLHLDLRYLLATDPRAVAGDGEAVANGRAVLRWVDEAALEELADSSLRRAVAALRSSGRGSDT